MALNDHNRSRLIGATHLAGLLIVWLVPLPTWSAGTDTRPAGRPNILVIMSDEHNASVMGCAGNRIARTPTLDRLAAQGIIFDAAYTNSPLCVPSRMSFTTGKYISHINVWSNNALLPADDVSSLPRALAAAGYEPYLCGKMHYDADRRYGFTEIGQSRTNQEHKDGRGGRRRADDLTPSGRVSGRFDNIHPGDESSVLSHDRKVTELTVDFLSRRKGAEKPFFYLAGYLAPHFPIIVPERYWEPYKGKVPMPVLPPGYLESLPLNYRHLRVGFDVVGVDDATVGKARELYYGYVQWLDDEIAKVLKALGDSGLADNTVIVYTTDHGENMGEHGLWWKNCAFDTAARVPLIISWPQRWPGGQRRAGACSLVDVAQTIAEIGGATTPTDWDGDSMCGWMDDPKAKWKDLAVSEYYAHHIASGYAMIRTGPHKYVYHTPPDNAHPAQRELYDLKADAGELKNLAADPAQAARIQEMHAALLTELGEDPDRTELRCRADFAKAAGKGENARLPRTEGKRQRKN